MDQKYLTDSEFLSLNIEATCLLLSSPRNFQYEIKTDKYNPYPSMISMFTSDSQHPHMRFTWVLKKEEKRNAC